MTGLTRDKSIVIICAAPNTAVDRTIVVAGLQIGEIIRARETLNAAGGKGVNVARAGRLLGADTVCMGFLGGDNGHVAEALASREGLQAVWTWIEGETRSCHIIIDEPTRTATVVNESGPRVAPEEWQRFHTDVLAQAAAARWVCFSGSLPPGVAPERLGELVTALCETVDTNLWVDTSGGGLQHVVELGLGPLSGRLNVKVNSEESGAVLGHAISGMVQAADAAQTLCSRGLRSVVLTLGSQGAIMAGAAGVWQATPPALNVISPVGSGDCFLAGLVTALAGGAAMPEAVCRGVASGSANALMVGGGRFSLADFESIFSQITLEKITSG